MLNAQRQGLIILGMHRSGTSAVAGTAVRLGLAAPLTPLPSAEDNPSGFYESHPIVEINHHLLRAENCFWDTCLTYEPERLNQRLQADDRQAMANILIREFGASAGFVMKDPRLCLTLSAWLPAFETIGASPVVLIVVRHPLEVSYSLMKRNGFSQDTTAALWLWHMLEAERLSRGTRRAILFYSHLLHDWRSSVIRTGQTAGITWPLPIEQAASDIDNFLSASARHHAAPTATAAMGPPGLRDMVNAAWGMFLQLSDDPMAPIALNCLDYLRIRFIEWRTETNHAGHAETVPPA